MNYELELYKLVEDKELVSELGWISNTEFCVWVSYLNLSDFINKAKQIFGYGMFDDGGFNASMQGDGVCIDLCQMVEGYICVEDVFPKEKYPH